MEISLDTYLIKSPIIKRKKGNTNINKNLSIILGSKKNDKEIKRSTSDFNNKLFDSYQNISYSFLTPEYRTKEKTFSNYEFTKDNITDFVNGFKTMKDLRSNKKIKNDNSINSFSPMTSQRYDNSLEKSIKNINFIKKEITWELRQKPNKRVFSREHEIEKINKILDKSNRFNININGKRRINLKNPFIKAQELNLLKSQNYNSSLTLNNISNSKNKFKESNLRKPNIYNLKKFEYNKDYLKPFKKEKIIKKFPRNEVEEFTNGLMYSPYS